MGDAMLRVCMLAMLMLLLLALPVAASVNESTLTITPENPTRGDIIVMQGKASPNENIPITISFQMSVPVSGGTFEYQLTGVEIPSPNRFTVVAEGCRRLSISASLFGIPITRTSAVEGSTQTISQSGVPSGKYNIRIFGDAVEGVSTVRIKVEAWTEIQADASGSFYYSYNSAPVPPGLFHVNVGGIQKTLMLSDFYPIFPTPTTPSPTPIASPTEEGSSSSEIYTSGPNPTDVYIPPENIKMQVVDYIFAVVKGEHITHELSEPRLDIRSIEFDSLGYADEFMIKVQELKNTSTLVDEPAPGTTYKSFRFFVDTQYDRITNIQINFRVENSWLENNSLNASSVALYRYAKGQWNCLNTTLVGQDETYTHYTAASPGFSVFAIVAQTHTNTTLSQEEYFNATNQTHNTESSAKPSMSSVGILGLIAALMCAYGLLRRG